MIRFSGRASQIRSMPFGDSSDDSSDGEEHPNQTETNTRITNSSSDNTDSSLGSGSSPSKSIKTTSSLSPAKRSSSGSPSKSVKRGEFINIISFYAVLRGKMINLVLNNTYTLYNNFFNDLRNPAYTDCSHLCSNLSHLFFLYIYTHVYVF